MLFLIQNAGKWLIFSLLLISQGLAAMQSDLDQFEAAINRIGYASQDQFELPDKVLGRLFPNLRSRGDLVRKIITDYLTKKIQKPESAWQYAGMSMCGCDNFKLSSRVFIAFKQLNDIVKRCPDFNKQLVHTSLGSGRLLQTFMLTRACVMFGYTNIVVNAIDPMLNSCDSLTNDFIRAMKEDFSHIQVKLSLFINADEYIDAVLIGRAARSHSFDMIDVGGEDWMHLGTLPPASMSLRSLPDNKKFFDLHNAMHVDGAKGTFMYVYFPYKEQYPIVRVDKRGVDKKLVGFARCLKRTCETGASLVLKKILENKNTLTSWTNPVNDQTFSITLGNAAWLDFAQLVDQTRLDSPVIYDGYSNKIKKYHHRYTGYKKRIQESDLVQGAQSQIEIF